MNSTGIEIERKFRLRAAPDADELAARAEDVWRVEQVYLRHGADGFHRRVRRIEHADGAVEYVLTRKAAIGDGTLSRRELEDELSEGAYEALLADADPGRRPIRKTRHVVPHGTQVVEVDVFDVPAGLVVAEVELGSEDERVDLPAWLGEAVEVTADRRYFNAALAVPDAEVPPFPEVER